MTREERKELADNVRYRYYEHNGGRIVAAYHKGEDGDVVLGCSYCSPEDQFVKTKGRYLAMRRLLDHPTYGVADDLDGIVKELALIDTPWASSSGPLIRRVKQPKGKTALLMCGV